MTKIKLKVSLYEFYLITYALLDEAKRRFPLKHVDDSSLFNPFDDPFDDLCRRDSLQALYMKITKQALGDKSNWVSES